MAGGTRKETKPLGPSRAWETPRRKEKPAVAWRPHLHPASPASRGYQQLSRTVGSSKPYLGPLPRSSKHLHGSIEKPRLLSRVNHTLHALVPACSPCFSPLPVASTPHSSASPNHLLRHTASPPTSTRRMQESWGSLQVQVFPHLCLPLPSCTPITLSCAPIYTYDSCYAVL